MTDFNKVTVHGRIVKNAEFTTTDSGLTVARFSIATNRARRLADGTYAPEDDTSFFPLAIFGKYAINLGKYLQKGRGVLIEGHLKQQKWEKDGERRSDTVICVDKIYFDPNTKKSENQVAVGVTVNPPQQTMHVSVPAVPFVQEEESFSENVFDFPPPEVMECVDIY